MAIRLQMAGTGSAFAKNYFNNNALVYSGKFTLLIDCGITAPLAFHHMGFPIENIDAVLITHLHADHIGGLEELAFRLKYMHHKKISLYSAEELIHPLWENSLKAGMESLDEGFCRLEDFFSIVPMRENRVYHASDHLHLEIVKTEHVPKKPSYSLFINGGVFYSADCRFDRKMLEHVHRERGCRTILHDCQLGPPVAVHATLTELLTLPEEMQETIFLMHYGDDMEQFRGKTGKMRFLEQHKVYEF